jgi:hypothetical protein
VSSSEVDREGYGRIPGGRRPHQSSELAARSLCFELHALRLEDIFLMIILTAVIFSETDVIMIYAVE